MFSATAPAESSPPRVSSLARLRRWAGPGIFHLCACLPTPPAGSSSDTAGSDTTGATTSETAGSDATTSDTAGSDTTGQPCSPWAPLECPPAPDTEPHEATLECASRGMGDCAGPVKPGGQEECRWVSTVEVGVDGDSCADATDSGACIALSYYGDGCAVVQTCGGAIEGTTYYRVLQDCTVETFTAAFCGYSPIDWFSCAWSLPAPEEHKEGLGACAPPPSVGPAACQCACPGD